MLEEGHREGAIGQSELELIKNVFEFDDTTVATILTPISQVQTLGAKTPVRAAIQAVRSQNYSRMPVTGRDKKDVVGILYAKDLLRAKLHPVAGVPDATIDTLMHKPLFVPASLRLNSLFRDRARRERGGDRHRHDERRARDPARGPFPRGRDHPHRRDDEVAEMISLSTLLFLLVPLLLLEGFYSGSEIALLSADKLALKRQARHGLPGAKLALDLASHPDRVLSTTLLMTSLCVITISALAISRTPISSRSR
jgi:CBS domain containing-hemolysin-like protein